MLSEHIALTKQKINDCATKARRETSNIRLIAVSKTFDAELVRQAYDCGLREFGENYADELVEKSALLNDLRDLRWIFIGQLQSNKIQKIMQVADEIQSIATEKHARYIQRYAHQNSKSRFPVWICVNAGEESTKQGISFLDLPQLANFISTQCPNLELQGVMAIPPSTFNDKVWLASNSSEIPDLYQRLRHVASSTGLGKLSLGMSADLALAIEAGSDCIRIGSAIFGPRKSR
jgi:pyridoxal phosphate enzyme (YggS family)